MGKLNMECSLWLRMADAGAPDANEANGFETVADVPATARGKAEEAANDVATGASVRSEGKLRPMEEGLLKMECSLWLRMADAGAPDANEANGFETVTDMPAEKAKLLLKSTQRGPPCNCG